MTTDTEARALARKYARRANDAMNSMCCGDGTGMLISLRRRADEYQATADTITALLAENERLREALVSLLDNITAPHTSYETGCCMCGMDMDCPAEAHGHSPTDSGVYYMEAATELARAALKGADDD